jgi:hypothetical protein
MDLATATALVKAYAATDNEPTLSDGEVQIILSQAKRPDAVGTGVGAVGYVDNYDANYAIRMAWEMKAGKAADKYTFLAGGNQFIRGSMITHCQQMADRWKSGSLSTLTLSSSSFDNYRANYLRYYQNVTPNDAA